MSKLIERPDVVFLSQLYATDAPDAVLLAEYPSSNSPDTRFRNDRRFIIHDPFPPPPRELLKTLGPHHLMCGWGTEIAVTSELAPPDALLNHWQRVFGNAGVPRWISLDTACGPDIGSSQSPPTSQTIQPQSTGQLNDPPTSDASECITLFPHQRLSAAQQVIDPDVYYHLHAKQAIADIACPQAEVFDRPQFPCIAKLSHGYAGTGNYLLHDEADLVRTQTEIDRHWPDSTLVYNAIIPNIVGDYGVQFYLHRDGSVVWLGLTRQHFNDSSRWCGGSFSAEQQRQLRQPLTPFVEATAEYLRGHGYFGVVGIDVLKSQNGSYSLVDLNPRLTGISPFLMAARLFARREGHQHGIYQASQKFVGSIDQLISTAQQVHQATVLILAAVEQTVDEQEVTICHLSASSDSESRCREAIASVIETSGSPAH